MYPPEIETSGLDHLVEIAKHHGLSADRRRINFEYSVGEEPLTELRFMRIAQDIGLQVAKTSGGIAGAWAGFKAGAAVGGAGGAAFAGVGAIPGAVVGGIGSWWRHSW